MTREPLRLAFLGCGFITQVHSRHLKGFRPQIACSYASRDAARAEEYCRRFQGTASYADYAAAIDDPRVDAVVVAVPPRFHLDLTLRALAAGKHVLVEKPAFPRMEDYRTVIDARNQAKRIVLVGENDHYKPLAVVLRKLVAEGAIGDMVFAHFTTIAKRLKRADDWRNDESMAGGDAFFEEGIHWLHIAGSLGPKIVSIDGYRPSHSREGPDKRAKSMMVAFSTTTVPSARSTTRARYPRSSGDCDCRSCTGAAASSHSNPTACSCWPEARACRVWSFPAFATSAATRRCTATSMTPSPPAVRLK